MSHFPTGNSKKVHNLVIKQKFEQFCKDCNDQLSTVRTQLSKTKRIKKLS